jgi:hypothetical protein
MTTSRSEGPRARAGHRSALAIAALELAAAGHPLIPLHTPSARGCSCGRRDCGRPGKHPRGCLGLRSASSDLDQVEAWWWAQPEANIGMRCDGLVVFDLDGPEGRDSLERLQEELGELPPSRAQGSGRGQHIFFGISNEITVSNSTFPLGYPPGLDLRAGRRGYVVAAPSRHASGSRYHWLDESAPTAPLPSTWLERLQQPPRSPSTTAVSMNGATTGYGLVALRRELAKVRKAPEGKRNEALNRSTFKLAQLVAGGELALGDLVDGTRACALANGLTSNETNATIESAVKAGLGYPRRRAPR